MNSYTKTPVNSVWVIALLSLVLGLLVFAGDQAINAVFSMSVTALYVAYSIPIIVRFTSGKEFQPGPFNLGIFSLPVAIIAVIFMTIMGIIFLFPESPIQNAQEMNYSVVVIGGTLLLSVIWYYFPKYGGVHWFTGPVPNINLDESTSSSLDPSTWVDEKQAVDVDIHEKP